MGLKDKKWFQAIVKIAPGIATAIGGPFGGLAATVLKEVTGLDKAGVEKAIAEGDPNIFLQLKTAEQKFEIELERIGLEREALEYGDIDSARARQMAMKDHTPAILTGANVRALPDTPIDREGWQERGLSRAGYAPAPRSHPENPSLRPGC